MDKVVLATPKGFRDYLPEDALRRRFVVGKIVEVFERFGFAPLETPTLEYAQTLKGKYGEEEKLIYEFETRGGDKIALKYDQTVPLARVIAQYPELPKPFKRYQVQPEAGTESFCNATQTLLASLPRLLMPKYLP
ncbi:MAG: Histidyl-tRNA synthetase [Candidatus Daviesbacteria bacterium GW2011_GWA1_38_7]|nr:MAG: Histidyl-tRNA synthetase [Candidatus Daviesbacteria bacterium GW2011_GWA1_38_7]